MCKNICYIRGNAGISIFYDTIFCFGGIYSCGWYLVKRNIAVYQIKATMVVAAQQQLHLKGYDVADFYAPESFAEHITSYRYTNYTPHYDCANLIVILDLKDSKDFFECNRWIWRGKNDSTTQWRAKGSTGLGLSRGQQNRFGLRSKTRLNLQDLLSQQHSETKRVSESAAYVHLFQMLDKHCSCVNIPSEYRKYWYINVIPF